jgi:Helitron helicase-like domain at N-terminus
MYLLYDMIQLRRSALGNSMIVKRQNWISVKNDIASLTVEQLQAAANAISNKQPIENPTIRRLQRDITTIGMQVPESFSQKLLMRSEVKGSIVRGGEPAIWATINPSDLQNPVVLILAGIEIPTDALPAASAAIRQTTG